MISSVGSDVRRQASVTTIPTMTPTRIPPAPTNTNARPASAAENSPVIAAATANR